MSFLDNETGNALQEVRDKIQMAIVNNDAKSVYFYQSFEQLVECNEMIKFIKSLNQPALRNLTNYLEGKIEYLMRQVSIFNDVEYFQNN